MEFQDYESSVSKLGHSHQDFHKGPQGILMHQRLTAPGVTEEEAPKSSSPLGSRWECLLEPFDTLRFVTSQFLMTHPRT